MEILNTYQNSRTILVVSDFSEKQQELINILSKKYKVVSVACDFFDVSCINQRKGQFSALILCRSKAEENNFEILKYFSDTNSYTDIPVIVFFEKEEETEYSIKYLKNGADDIITFPYYPDLILHRISRNIQLINFSTFYEIENILRELPSNIYMKDNKGKYIFATHYWHHLDHKDNPDWTIRGKTDVEIRKDKDNAIKAMESDKEILKSGKGTSYTIEINSDGKREFYEVIKQPFFDKDHKVAGIIALLNNVTDRELLRISLEKNATVDELTQVYNRRFFDQYTLNITESGKYPFSIISADCNYLKKINDTFGHLAGDEYIKKTALLLRIVIGSAGLIFRMGGDEFVILLPETKLEKATEMIKKLKETESHFCIRNIPLSVSYGAWSVNSEDDDFISCLNKADKLMYAEKANYKKQVAQLQNT